MQGTGNASSATIRFGVFELDTRTGEFRKRGVKLKLTDQAYRILLALVQQSGHLVTREELKQTVWPDRTFGDFDSAINKSVSQIRALLGDNGPTPRYVETLSRRGYRFVAPVVAQPAAGGGAPTTIAVLPFENLIGDPGEAYIAGGLTEELTTGLGRFDRVSVVSRTTAQCCAAAAKSLAVIGRDLRVNAVIEGSVMRVGEALRVNVRLVDIQSERIVWQSKYDSELRDLLVLCERLTQDVAAEIKASPKVSGLSARRSIQVSPEAHLAYLKGRYFWNKRTEQDLYRSIDEFHRALAIDPQYALAHTGLADAYVILGIWGLEPSHSAFRMARRSAERALELDDTLAEAHTCLAEVLKDYDWDWTGAESAYRRAIALNPNYSTAHHFYAQLLVSLRRYAEAAEQMELARRVDPLSPAINAYVPYIYLAARDYARASDEGLRAVELEPRSPAAHWQFGRACLFSGDVTQAVDRVGDGFRSC